MGVIRPMDPGPSGWVFPDPMDARPGDDLVASGAAISAPALLDGYRLGLFPMHNDGVLWWLSPDPRGVLRPADLHASRSMRRSQRRFAVEADGRFDAVVAGCADSRRPHGWITAEYADAYSELFRLGWAHSVEVFDGAELVGGLFGIQLGGLFLAESKFHRARDASKVAVAALCAIQLGGADPADRLIDVQWRTEHLASLGVTVMPRPLYLATARRLMSVPAPAWPAAGRRFTPAG